MDYEFLAFDLDGTLIDSSGDITWAANRVLKTLGREGQSLESVRSKIGSGVRVLLERLMPDMSPRGIEEARVLFIKEYSGHTVVDTVLYEGVYDTLAHFEALGKSMAIVTNKPELLAYPILDELGIARFFSVVVGGDTYGSRKPNPEPLLGAIGSMRATVASTVYIGDSGIDAETGRLAGTYTVGVSYGFGGVLHEIESAGFDIVIPAISELKSIVG